MRLPSSESLSLLYNPELLILKSVSVSRSEKCYKLIAPPLIHHYCHLIPAI